MVPKPCCRAPLSPPTGVAATHTRHYIVAPVSLTQHHWVTGIYSWCCTDPPTLWTWKSPCDRADTIQTSLSAPTGSAAATHKRDNYHLLWLPLAPVRHLGCNWYTVRLPGSPGLPVVADCPLRPAGKQPPWRRSLTLAAARPLLRPPRRRLRMRRHGRQQAAAVAAGWATWMSS